MNEGNGMPNVCLERDVVHAEVVCIDVSEALKAPGVIEWVIGRDVHGKRDTRGASYLCR